MIRIENSTEFKIDSVQLIYDVTIYNYATISSNEATHYHLFKSLPDDAAQASI